MVRAALGLLALEACPLCDADKCHLLTTCSAWSNKLITAKDHASIQINIGHLNKDGTYSGQFTTFAMTGKTRSFVRVLLFAAPCTFLSAALSSASLQHCHHPLSRMLLLTAQGESDAALDILWRKKASAPQ